MRLRLAAGSSVSAILVTLVFAVQPVLADHCWGPSHAMGNPGASYSQYQVFNAGVRSEQDFESASVPIGTAVVHPMQILSITGDFIGWGTARGVGVDDCPDDYSLGWQIYIDGYKFGVYFCRQQYGSVAGAAQDELFTLRYGDCNGTDKWRAFHNGVRKTCQAIDDDSAFYLAVGSEIIGTSSILHADIHFDDLSRYNPTNDFWYSWTSGAAAECESNGYRTRIIAADDVWTEEIP